jgi:hypothetical protein
VIDWRTYCFFPASSLGTMHAYNSANLSPPLGTRTWLISYSLMSMILIFWRLWMIPIWILFCYKRQSNLSSLWKTSIGFWRGNQRHSKHPIFLKNKVRYKILVYLFNFFLLKNDTWQRYYVDILSKCVFFKSFGSLRIRVQTLIIWQPSKKN